MNSRRFFPLLSSDLHSRCLLPYDKRIVTTEICAIGIDVGGTKIAAGVVTRAGELLFHRRLPTGGERGGEAALRDVEALSVELINRAEEAGMKVAGIGLCVAELVDLDGNVTSGHTIKWDGWPIRERLSRIAPTVIESDVRAAALAEAIYGAGRGSALGHSGDFSAAL